MKKAIHISLASALFLLAAAAPSWACSCMASTEPEKVQVKKSYTSSRAVFSAEVIDVTESVIDNNELIVKLKVSRSWKGRSVREVTITTAKESAMCGYVFEVGKTYLVYADGRADDLSVYNCSRTARLDANADTKYLSRPRPPRKPTRIQK